ncbi:MAG: endolytic transglycosylase MltG [Myxococcales bacterium]|nr:endolytic transglycosylase MltG [Myxococcales bacterium]
MSWAAWAFAAFLGVFVLLGVGLFLFASRVGPAAGQRFVVSVPEGKTPREIAALLAEEGLVSSELFMSLYLGLSPGPDPVPGEHFIEGGRTPSELRSLLGRSPDRPGVKVTIPEGFTRFAIAERLETSGICPKESFLAATSDPLLLEALEIPGLNGLSPASAEGYLFPATYPMKLDTPAREIVERLVREAHARWARLAESEAAGVANARAWLGWGRAELVALASMIEKEAAVADERPTIASVFYNRLLDPGFSPKLLQSDPTSAYGCLAAPTEAPSCASFEGKVTGAMNRDSLNRYSTYTHEGLPPGPIANPGEASIRAALAPAETRYFFFVAKGGGRHAFSETLEAHNRAVRGSP